MLHAPLVDLTRPFSWGSEASSHHTRTRAAAPPTMALARTHQHLPHTHGNPRGLVWPPWAAKSMYFAPTSRRAPFRPFRAQQQSAQTPEMRHPPIRPTPTTLRNVHASPARSSAISMRSQKRLHQKQRHRIQSSKHLQGPPPTLRRKPDLVAVKRPAIQVVSPRPLHADSKSIVESAPWLQNHRQKRSRRRRAPLHPLVQHPRPLPLDPPMQGPTHVKLTDATKTLNDIVAKANATTVMAEHSSQTRVPQIASTVARGTRRREICQTETMPATDGRHERPTRQAHRVDPTAVSLRHGLPARVAGTRHRPGTHARPCRQTLTTTPKGKARTGTRTTASWIASGTTWKRAA